MSVSFMVIAAPRSGTAWCANWLTTDKSLCLHDPLWGHHYSDLDAIEHGAKMLGVCCTGLWRFPKWLNQHPARKVILHRSIPEINESLDRIRLPALPLSVADALWDIDGFHVQWRDLFDNPKDIYEKALDLPFDAQRHKLLCHMNVQMAFETIEINSEAAIRLAQELSAICTEQASPNE